MFTIQCILSAYMYTHSIPIPSEGSIQGIRDQQSSLKGTVSVILSDP